MNIESSRGKLLERTHNFLSHPPWGGWLMKLCLLSEARVFTTRPTSLPNIPQYYVDHHEMIANLYICGDTAFPIINTQCKLLIPPIQHALKIIHAIL